VDYLVDKKGKVCPVEVKSGTSGYSDRIRSFGGQFRLAPGAETGIYSTLLCLWIEEVNGFTPIL
jgi:hypothetical protein